MNQMAGTFQKRQCYERQRRTEKDERGLITKWNMGSQTFSWTEASFLLFYGYYC